MKLFVGLGNPGSKYAHNRHNIGFMAVERIRERHSFEPWRKRFHGLVSDGHIGGARVLLLKPETYMNESGRAVGDAARFLKIPVADVVAFHDELDLDPGRLKVKSGGGNAGHNGLRSITQHVGNDYVRVRIGIGHPGRKDLVHGYVLHDFARADAEWIDPLLDAIADAAGWLAKGDTSRFQTEIARKSSAGQHLKAAVASPPPSPGQRASGTRSGSRSGDRSDAGSARAARPSQRDLARSAALKSGSKTDGELRPRNGLAETLKSWFDRGRGRGDG